MRFLAWLRAKDTRGPRAQCVLAAYFWNGGGATTAEVTDVNESSAFLMTTDGWCPGTILTTTLSLKSDVGAAKPTRCITLACKVVRHRLNGMEIKWLFQGHAERKKLAELLRACVAPGKTSVNE
jgi:hypothetical protein